MSVKPSLPNINPKIDKRAWKALQLYSSSDIVQIISQIGCDVLNM